MASGLLPDKYSDFRTKHFWEGFFKELDGKEFEWYGDWSTLQMLLEKYIPSVEAKILVPGCGNSALSPALYDTGRKNITNIDFSRTCIREMLSRHVRSRLGMRWLVMDMTSMTFPENSFDVVLDKGSLDAIMGDSEDPEGSTAAKKFLGEIKRVLDTRKDALYICISLAQTHVLQTLFDLFSSLHRDNQDEVFWKITMRSIPPTEDMIDSPWQPFAILVQNTTSPTSEILDIELDLDESIRNIEQSPHVLEVRKTIDEWSSRAKIEHKDMCARDASLSKIEKATIIIRPGQRLLLQLPQDLVNDESIAKETRYKVALLDANNCDNAELNTPCAAFLVPQGREHEWLFRSVEGQKELLSGCNTERLIIISLQRGQLYGSMKEIQAELSPYVTLLMPLSCREGKVSVQYLTIVDGVGKRKTIHQASSEINGEIVVEDVTLQEDGNSKLLRRMVFLSDSDLIQSEALLITKPAKVKSKRKKDKTDKNTVVNYNFLSCNYHMAMIAGMALINSQAGKAGKSMNVLLIGLGGGGLPMFMTNQFDMDMTVIELDPIVLSLATAYFGFQQSTRMKAIVGDGIKYIQSARNTISRSGRLFDAIIVDASGTSSESISCPPKPFLEDSFLEGIYDALEENGIVAMNVVSRSEPSFDKAVSSIKVKFPTVHCIRVDDDVNKVVFGSKTCKVIPLEEQKEIATKNLKQMQTGNAHREDILNNIGKLFML